MGAGQLVDCPIAAIEATQKQHKMIWVKQLLPNYRKTKEEMGNVHYALDALYTMKAWYNTKLMCRSALYPHVSYGVNLVRNMKNIVWAMITPDCRLPWWFNARMM